MATTVTAQNNAPQVLISENGAVGDKGSPGTNGTGLNNVRLSKLNNPLLHIFKTNQLTSVIAPNNQDSDLTWDRATTATYGLACKPRPGIPPRPLRPPFAPPQSTGPKRDTIPRESAGTAPRLPDTEHNPRLRR